MTTMTAAPPQTTLQMLSIDQIGTEDALVRDTPFHFFVAEGQLSPEYEADLDRDFPKYGEAGYLPYDPVECGPSFNALVDELTSVEVGNAIGVRLGIPDLGRYPTLVSVSRSLNHSHGTIHTDGKSKIVTALLYLSHDWPDTSDGCLRFLDKIDDIDSLVAPEVRPLYGTLAAFRRADNSFHGHLPMNGERRVIQVAWLVSEEAKLRKTRRGRMSRVVKWAVGLLGPHFHKGRDRNAYHG